MAKTYTAQNIVSINPVHFKVENGLVTGFTCEVEVNYGTMGMTETVDLWALMTIGQKAKVQAIYDTLRAACEAVIL